MDRLNASMEKLNNLPVPAQATDFARKFGGRWKLLFFSCAVCVTAAGVLSIITGFLVMAPPFDFINYCYLTLFGILMLILDVPFDNTHLRDFKISIFTYALFMTRFIGRGLWYLFLAAMTVGALWSNDVSPFLGFILGGYIGLVAIYSLVFGINLSRKLEFLRFRIRGQGPDQWAAYVPPQGMTKVQFRDLGASLANMVFSDEDLNYIVEGFSQTVRADDVISREEFEEWVTASHMMIL